MTTEVPQSLIDEVLTAVGSTPDRLLQILVGLQSRLDYLSPALISRLAARLGIARARVEGVAGFYSFLHLAPAGRYRVRFSDNIVDRMLGSEALSEAMCARLGVRPGELSEDGRVMISTTSCTGMGDQGQRQPRWWLQTRVESTFYRLNQNGRERRSGRISIAPMSGPEWILRPHTPGHAAPKLVLEWQPQTLVFNAQGQDFLLAVGAAPEIHRRWSGGPSPMAQVAPGYNATEIEQLERARPGPPMTAALVLEAPASDSQEALNPIRWRRFLLWSVLGFGVILLGFMSWRLYGQLNAADKED